MHVEQGEWVLDAGELAAVAGSLGLEAAGLSILPTELPPAAQAQEAVEAFLSLEPPFRALAERWLRALADPIKVVQLHNSVADERVSRCHLAWHPDVGGAWVTLVRAGDLRRLSMRSESELRFVVAGAVAADASIRPDRVAMDCSTPAALALLAAFDHLRRGHLVALLDHTERAGFFSPEDIQARVADAALEDFRWLLPFLGKLLPLPAAELGVARDARPSLVELEELGLVERVAHGGSVLCELTPGGRFLEDLFRNSSARAALSITAPTSGGVGHDVMLLVRSAHDLVWVSFSGGEASLSTILAGDLDEVLKAVFSPPRAAQAPTQGPTSKGYEETVILPRIQEPLPHLVVESGPARGAKFLLGDGVILGRQDDNGIVVDDRGISRRHAKFVMDGLGGWSVLDLGSGNGTYVNETRLEGPRALVPGDHIQVGETVLRFDVPVI